MKNGYLKGNYDGPGGASRYGKLTLASKVKKWIDSKPKAYCNTQQARVPASMEYTKKYYRWEKRISQKDMKASIKKYTKRNLGEILDLIPLERSVSGRITRLKIYGTKTNYVINNELDIRKALDSTTLWSSCFYVKRIKNGKIIPQAFIIKGAGFGHGVGMCQTGAGVMALLGKKYDKILKHYYKGIKIHKIY